MATPRMDITSFVGKLLEENDVDLLRDGVKVLAQAVMETEVSSQIGAAPYERSAGARCLPQRLPDQDAGTPGSGTIELKIPKVRGRRLLPARCCEPRRRAEKALHAVVVEAYVKGVSTRKVDDLVEGARDRRDLPLGGLQDLQGRSTTEVTSVPAAPDRR